METTGLRFIFWTTSLSLAPTLLSGAHLPWFWGELLRSHLETADMLMVLTAESPGFALRNFTESGQLLLFHVTIWQQLVYTGNSVTLIYSHTLCII